MAHSTTLLLCKERPWRCWRDTKQQHTMKRICLLVLIVAAVQTLSAQSYTGFEASLSTGFLNANHPELATSGMMWRGSLGSRINEHFYLGVDVGVIPGLVYTYTGTYNTYDEYGRAITKEYTNMVDWVVPLTVSLRTYYPLENTPLNFTCDFSMGVTVPAGEELGLFFLAMPGIQMPISSHLDLRLCAGASSIFLFDFGEFATFTMFNASIVFHSSSN